MENDDHNIDNKSSNSNDNVQMSKLLYCRRGEIELLFDYINMELEYGYTERVIAIIQAIIEFNSSNPHTAAVMPPTLAVEGNINDESDCCIFPFSWILAFSCLFCLTSSNLRIPIFVLNSDETSFLFKLQ